ncbi:hypothetical protein H0H92_009842 [Tricholoma furcatifolium]|nr:hypothetical protein H0H92_009842 [Tricholoma furcatifolium]
MASRLLQQQLRNASRYTRPHLRAVTQAPPPPSSQPEPLTHFKVTLRRSAISLGDKIKGTLVALGIHRRNQTVYHRHTPEAAGKILSVKELVEVHNVPTSQVKDARQQRLERKAPRGYKIVGNRQKAFMGVGEFSSL